MLQDVATSPVAVVGVPHAYLGSVIACVVEDADDLPEVAGRRPAGCPPPSGPGSGATSRACPLSAAGKLDRQELHRLVVGARAGDGPARLLVPRPADEPRRGCRDRGRPPVADRHRAGTVLAGCTAAELAAPVVAAVVDDAALPADEVDEVVLGNCMGPGGDVARVAALQAGLPVVVPGLTVDRQCASGLAAIGIGAALVRDGAAVVLAGGVESASTAPWRFWPPAPGGEPQRYHRAPFAPAALGDPDMGAAADDLAARGRCHRGNGRTRYAARSHARPPGRPSRPAASPPSSSRSAASRPTSGRGRE